MKPLFIILTLLAVNFASPVFATGRDIKPTVLKSFNATFSSAKDVEWTITENLYKARFELNGQMVNAYYSTSGSMLGVTRNINSHQLPLTLQTALKKDYSAFWITDLFELNKDEGTSYYVTIETADAKLVLQSNQNNWNIYSKSQKN